MRSPVRCLLCKTIKGHFLDVKLCLIASATALTLLKEICLWLKRPTLAASMTASKGPCFSSHLWNFSKFEFLSLLIANFSTNVAKSSVSFGSRSIIVSFSLQARQTPFLLMFERVTIHFPLPSQPNPCQPPPLFSIAFAIAPASHFLFPTLDAVGLLNQASNN